MRLRTYRRWGRQAIVESFQWFYFWNDRAPETFDLNNVLGLPNRATVHRAFGTLAAARIDAGLDAGHSGHGGGGRGGGHNWKPTDQSPEYREAWRQYREEYKQRLREEG